ncbi:MAG: hypothetical protein ABI629_22230 [bacterium]
MAGSTLVTRMLGRVREEGWAKTLRRAHTRLFGVDERYIFARRPKPPPAPLRLPIERQGVVVRTATPADADDANMRQHRPRDQQPLLDVFVATRDGHIVGAAWYTDIVNAAQPWYAAVLPHIALPAVFTANVFVVPGDKSAGWALVKTADEALAQRGVRSIVGMISTHNRPSILLARLLGARLCARVTIRYWLGRPRLSVAAVQTDDDAALRRPAPG